MSKMPTIKTGSVQGKATVEINETKGKVRVTFEDNPDKKYLIDISEAPSYVQGGEFYVKLNSDGTKIYSMSPQSGQYRVKIQKFVARENEEPVPYSKKMKFGDSVFFRVVLEITRGKLKGMTGVWELPYFFSTSEKSPLSLANNMLSNTLDDSSTCLYFSLKADERWFTQLGDSRSC